MVVLGLAVFLTFSSLVFVSGTLLNRGCHLLVVLVYAADMGIVATGYALAFTRFIRLFAARRRRPPSDHIRPH